MEDSCSAKIRSVQEMTNCGRQPQRRIHIHNQHQSPPQMPSSALTLKLQQSAVLVVSFSYRIPLKPQEEAQPSTTN